LIIYYSLRLGVGVCLNLAIACYFRADYTITERVLKEKEQVISELLEEGEKLSKQQLQSNNIIKKLRSKEKENETSLKQMRCVYLLAHP
jgi:hypothetical protein